MVRKRWKSLPQSVRLCLAVWLALWLYQTVPLWIPRFVFPPKGKTARTVTMQVTAYCHCGQCCSYTDILGVIPVQRRGDWWKWGLKRVGVTSSGKYSRYGTIAADPALFPYGTVMKVPGYGYGVVLDTGSAIKGNHIDLYYPCHLFARLHGIRTVPVKVWK